MPALPDWVRHPAVDEAERHKPALRIVSAAPNVTEICCALGLRAALVGRTRYCDYPPGIEDVCSIGALIDVNVERLLELRPDFILVSGTSRTQTERFAPLKLRFESVPDNTLNDLFAAIRRIGALTGRERTAERLCRAIRGDLRAVSERFAGAPHARVLFLTGTLSDPPSPPYVAGPGSFYDDLLKLAGHENVVAGEQQAFAPLSLEFIIRADPDVIIELDPDGRQRPGGDADARRAWNKIGALRAVTHRRVHVLVGPEHYLLGPRIAHTYAALCRALAGETHD
jgi:iron complex transport system substrate-binding protein